MRVASHCQDRALLLLQVAQECPRLREQAEFIASEWLLIAALRIDLARIRQAENDADLCSPDLRQPFPV
jgi:hypothetical protein